MVVRRVDTGERWGRRGRRQVARGGYRTKWEALSAERRFLIELEDDATTATQPAGPTVGEFLVEWLVSSEPTRRPTTSVSYERCVRDHVIPHLGTVRLRELAPEHVRSWQAVLLRTPRRFRDGPLSTTTVRYCHRLLRRALQDAAQLFARIIEEYAEPASEVAFAYEKRGDLFRSRGLAADAEASYRAAIAVAPTLSGTTGEVHLALAEVLLERDGVAAQAEVESLLNDARPHLSFNSTIFRWHVLRARLAAVRGDLDAERSAAHDALAIVGVDLSSRGIQP